MTLRSSVRASVESVACVSGMTALGRRLHRHRVAILAYHNVVDEPDVGHGDASLHLPMPLFIAQIDSITRTHEVAALDDVVADRPSRRPRAVITFDDAYAGAVSLALPELIRRGLPATVFVAPALLDTASTWWDELGAADRMSEDTREAALHRFGGRADRVRAALLEDASPMPLPPSYGIASATELRAACRDGITAGSHSWAHEHLPSLGETELRESLARARAWLQQAQLPVTDWLSLPYGAGSRLVRQVARDVGHTGVLRVNGGLAMPARDAKTGDLPRINVPAGMSVRGLELRLAGLYSQ